MTLQEKIRKLGISVQNADSIQGGVSAVLNELSRLTESCDAKNDEAAVVTEAAEQIIAALLFRQNKDDASEKDRAKNIIDKLSYSELEAAIAVFTKSPEGGVIIASRIADETGIARSTIVSAIKKMESAGVLTSRSLGIKGTHIKIANGHISKELLKMR